MEECYPLDGRRIDVEGTLFFIHGIVHENPLVSISEEFKSDVAKKLNGYSVICEDGLTSWIPGAKSFNETAYFGFNKLTPSHYFSFLKGFFYNKFIKKTHKTPLARKVKAIKTLEDLEPIREELFKSYFPEPQGMNMLIERICGGTLDNPKGELPLRVRRYLYETEESLDYAKKENLDELHILVGCAHELPLEYLLSKKRNI